MQLWAHRGGGKGPLENTLEGFELAVKHGFKAVEFDVMTTSDGMLVVHHDFCLGRLAQPMPGSGIAPTARVADLHSAQMAHVTVHQQPILAFSSFLPFLIQHGLIANVELKADSPEIARLLGAATSAFIRQQAPEIQQVIERDWVFSSFYHASLLPLTGYRKAILYELLDDTWIVHADALDAEAVHLHWSGATDEVVRRIHATGRKVRVYTVNDSREFARLQALGIDGIFTDCITEPLA